MRISALVMLSRGGHLNVIVATGDMYSFGVIRHVFSPLLPTRPVNAVTVPVPSFFGWSGVRWVGSDSIFPSLFSPFFSPSLTFGTCKKLVVPVSVFFSFELVLDLVP